MDWVSRPVNWRTSRPGSSVSSRRAVRTSAVGRAARALVPARLLPDLVEAMEAAARTGTGHEGVAAHLRTCHLAEHENLLCIFAYSLLRGSGPAVPVQALWGMDPRLGARLLAGLAAAMDPASPNELLSAAEAHLAALIDADEPVEDPRTAP
jgi:hypothetical protein